MSALTIAAIIAVVIYVMGRQLMGEPIRGKRLIILPAVLTVIGALDLAKHNVHPSGTDVLLIAIGAVIAAAVGLTQGRMMRLEQRDGGLWGQLPLQGLWLWALLYISRGAMFGIAHVANAHVAAGTQAELLILGVNRLGQAASIAIRSMAAGIPFTAEKDGSQPLAGMFPSRGSASRAASQPGPRSSAYQPERPTFSTSATPEAAGDSSPPAGVRSQWADIGRQLCDVASDAVNARTQDRQSRRTDRRRRR